VGSFGILLVHILLNYLFINVFSLGLQGAAWAKICTQWLLCGTLWFWLMCKYWFYGLKTWVPWSKKALVEWRPLLVVALKGAMSSLLLWSILEIIGIEAGLKGTVELASQALLINTFIIILTIFTGLTNVIGFRVGTLLGANKPDAILSLLRVSFFSALIFGSVLAIVLVVFAREWFTLLASDQAILKRGTQLMPIVASLCLVLLLQATQVGALRGANRIGLLVLGVLGFYWCFSIPLGWVLAFKLKWGLSGLWAALTIAYVLVFFLYGWFLMRIDWYEEALTVSRIEAKKRQDAEVVGLLSRESRKGQGELNMEHA